MSSKRQLQPSGSETQSLAQVEWEHIERVLGDCAGNVSEAARRLRINLRTLQRKRRRKQEQAAAAPDRRSGEP